MDPLLVNLDVTAETRREVWSPVAPLRAEDATVLPVTHELAITEALGASVMDALVESATRRSVVSYIWSITSATAPRAAAAGSRQP